MAANQTNRRRGAVMIFVAGFILTAVTMAALVVDVGYLTVTKSQLQAGADSAALGGGADLLKGLGVGATLTPTQTQTLARQMAVTYAGNNRAAEQTSIYCNGTRDVRFGNAIFDSSSGTWIKSWNTAPYNMIGVSLLRNQTSSTNGDGPLPLFFSGILGASTNLSVTASAALLPSNTFHITPGSGLKAGVLPLTVDLATWTQLMNGTGPDSFNYNSSNNTVTNGSDGIKELDLYPSSETGADRGTVDLGAPNNSAADLKRQITSGLNESDLAHFPNGEMTATEQSPLVVDGDPGLSNGIKSSLESIIGQPRAVAVYTSFGDGKYTIIKFVGLRIVAVEMTGNPKHVWAQPAPVVDPTLTPQIDQEISSDSIFAPIILIE